MCNSSAQFQDRKTQCSFKRNSKKMNLRLFNVVCILLVVYGIVFSLASTRKTSSFQEKNDPRFNEAQESLDKERNDDSWNRNRYVTGMKAFGRGKRLFHPNINCPSCCPDLCGYYSLCMACGK